MAPLIPAVGYVRVSMAREEMLSPALQRTVQERWAKANGRRITEWVEDPDKTGRNFRRKVMGLIRRVEAGECGEIIIYRYDRWGRNAVEALANARRVELAGGSLISATEPLDPDTAIGKYSRTNAFALAEMQSDIIGENWHLVMSHRRDAGLPAAGRAARFGYRRLGRVRKDDDAGHRTRRLAGQEERYVPDPALGQVLAGMYRAYTAGEGSTVIARRLNDAGIRNTAGKLWSGRTVLAVLDSGFGAGLLRTHDPSCRCRDGGRCRRRVLIPGRHKPVITETEWAAYLARREETSTEHAARVTPLYAVTGLARCGHCGGALVATGNAAGRPVNFRCIRQHKYQDCAGGGVSVPLAALLAAAREFIAELAADVDAVEVTAGQRAATAIRARGDADRIAAELAAADRRLTRLALLAADSDDLPAAAWQEAARAARAERDQLAGQLAAVTRQASRAAADPLPAIVGLLENWDHSSGSEMNLMLRTVVREIRVWKTGPSVRDDQGHWKPQETAVRLIPLWEAGDGSASI